MTIDGARVALTPVEVGLHAYALTPFDGAVAGSRIGVVCMRARASLDAQLVRGGLGDSLFGVAGFDCDLTVTRSLVESRAFVSTAVAPRGHR